MNRKRILLVALGLLVWPPLAWSVNYYVSSSTGDDGNGGTTAEAALQSLDAVHGLDLKPGDRVLFRRGDVWRGMLTIRAEGTPDLPIRFEAFGEGPNPRILGAQELTNWTRITDEVFEADVAHAPNHVVVRSDSGDVKLKRAGKFESVEGIAPDSFVFREDGEQSKLVVRHRAGGSLRADVAASEHGIRGEGGYVVIDGLDVEVSQWANILIMGNGGPWTISNLSVRYGWGSNKRTPAGGIEVRSAPGSVIDNVTVRDSHGDGIFVRCPRVTVQNSRVFTVYKGFNPGGDCIQFSSGKTDGFRILNNWVTQQGTDTPKGCIQQEFGDDGIVRGNVVLYGVFGIEVNGNDIAIEDNTIGFSGVDRAGVDPFSSGIYISEHRGYENVIIRNNVIFGCDQMGIGLEATNGKRIPPYHRSRFRILNNTIVDCRIGVRTTVPFSGTIQNNVLSGIRQQAFEIESLIPGEPFVMDHNLVSGAPAPLVRIGTQQFETFAEHFAQTGQSAHSQAAPAGFLKPELDGLQLSEPDASLPDFTPVVGSPQVDAGVFVGRWRDWAGNAVPQGNGVDLGAIESSYSSGEASSPPPPVTGLEAYASATDKVTLRWADPGTEVVGFELHRSDTEDFSPSDATLVEAFIESGPWQDDGLQPGQEVHYLLRAIGRTGVLSEAARVSVTTVPATPGQLVSESFEYPEGQALAGMDGGIGFAGPWDGPHQSSVIPSGTLAAPLASRGAGVELKTPITRILAKPLDFAAHPVWLGVALSPTHRSKSLSFFLKQGDENVVNLRVGPSFAAFLNGERAGGESGDGMRYFLLSLDGNKASLWINPDLSDGDPGSPVVTAALPAGLQPDRIELNYSNPSEHRGVVDEIRIGTTLAAVVNDSPPDTIAPEPPRGVRVESLGTERAAVTWDQNPEADIAAYEVVRVATPEAEPSATPLASVTRTAFVDSSAQPPGPVHYKVIAVDAAGNRSQPSAAGSAELWLPGKQLLAYEPFVHEGDPGTVQGFGWAEEDWTAASGKFQITAESLEFPEVETHGGRIHVVGGTGRALASPLRVDVDGGVWVGFLMRERNSGREGSVSLSSAGSNFLTVAHRPGSPIRVNQEPISHDGRNGTHLVLIHLEHGSVRSDARVWIDPVGITEPRGEPDAIVPIDGIAALDGFHIGHFPASLFHVEVDEIRVGRSAADARVGFRPSR